MTLPAEEPEPQPEPGRLPEQAAESVEQWAQRWARACADKPGKCDVCGANLAKGMKLSGLKTHANGKSHRMALARSSGSETQKNPAKEKKTTKQGGSPLRHVAPVVLDTKIMRDVAGYVPSDIQDAVAEDVRMRSSSAAAESGGSMNSARSSSGESSGKGNRPKSASSVSPSGMTLPAEEPEPQPEPGRLPEQAAESVKQWAQRWARACADKPGKCDVCGANLATGMKLSGLKTHANGKSHRMALARSSGSETQKNPAKEKKTTKQGGSSGESSGKGNRPKSASSVLEVRCVTCPAQSNTAAAAVPAVPTDAGLIRAERKRQVELKLAASDRAFANSSKTAQPQRSGQPEPEPEPVLNPALELQVKQALFSGACLHVGLPASPKTGRFKTKKAKKGKKGGSSGKEKQPESALPEATSIEVSGRSTLPTTLPGFCYASYGQSGSSRKASENSFIPDFVVSNTTVHARKRMKERGVKPSAVYQNKPGAGVKVRDGVVLTVVPPAWAAGAGQYSSMPERKPKEGEHSETIDCPASALGGVIGKGGETAQKIRKQSGVRLLGAEDNPPRIEVTGSEPAVRRARAMVEAVLSKHQLRSVTSVSAQAKSELAAKSSDDEMDPDSARETQSTVELELDAEFGDLFFESNATIRARKELLHIYKRAEKAANDDETRQSIGERLAKIDLFLHKYEGKEEELLLAVRRKYLVNGETRPILLKRFSRGKEGRESAAADYIQSALGPIQSALARLAEELGGCIGTAPGSGPAPSTNLLVQVPAELDTTPGSKGLDVIDRMRNIVHNRHKIGDGRTVCHTGHLLASASPSKAEQRKLEKLRTQHKKHGSFKRGGAGMNLAQRSWTTQRVRAVPEPKPPTKVEVEQQKKKRNLKVEEWALLQAQRWARACADRPGKCDVCGAKFSKGMKLSGLKSHANGKSHQRALKRDARNAKG
jgi:hypothetical protein